MNVLAMDTSTLVMGVAVLDERRLLGEILTNQKKNHSVRLMPTVERLLSELDVSAQDLDLIAVAMGPGSYTGVRIGVTTAKMMAWGLGLPLAGVSTLLVMAASLGPVDGWICPLIDARRGRVYTGLYRCESGRLRLVQPETVTVWSDWVEEVLATLDGPVWLAGDDALLHQETARATLGERLFTPAPEERLPRPSLAGRLALLRHQGDDLLQGLPESVLAVVEGDAVHQFVPRYLQMTEVEQKLLARSAGGCGQG